MRNLCYTSSMDNTEIHVLSEVIQAQYGMMIALVRMLDAKGVMSAEEFAQTLDGVRQGFATTNPGAEIAQSIMHELSDAIRGSEQFAPPANIVPLQGSVRSDAPQ